MGPRGGGARPVRGRPRRGQRPRRRGLPRRRPHRPRQPAAGEGCRPRLRRPRGRARRRPRRATTRSPPCPLLPERLLPCRLEGIRLLGVYGPASDPLRYASRDQRQRKRAWLTGLTATLFGHLDEPTLLVGDLNVVAPGHADPLPHVLDEETAAYEGLTGDLGLLDVVARDLDGAEVSWVDHTGAGCRYDHALATADLADGIRGVALDPTPRVEGWTDHSALALVLRGDGR